MSQFNYQRTPSGPDPRASKIAEALRGFARKNTRLLIIIGIILIAALVLMNESFFIVGEA